ncbi:NEW3 domain-containing protein [Allokutzneria sp. NRRL B-24872]|uniref:glycoside hydrolase family 38 N-terminal domain-containing protein n=1 Tax=Allokutzneria sp. NRRL B-24872 TaxID=1137961 RepID=UPI000A3BBA06|nr:NEW3 domain-containing protein [Allokutzneria sp. NRRL B-24872]
MPKVLSAESTELFTGPADAPLQVVRVTLDGPATVRVTGAGLDTPEPVSGDGVVEVSVSTSDSPGTVVPARVITDHGAEFAFDLTVAEPGWTMHMVSHFHYDPVWWNTQAAYTTAWDALDFPGSPRSAYQLAGFDLVRAHLALALREPEYKFVLAEVDYLKPYWDAFPADRDVLRRLIAEGRVEVMGGTYNEPNTNLCSPESAIRNFVHGIGFQRDVLGADPQTAWQLDVFGHDPAFPGMAADAGLSSSSWARGPFHQWGPMEVRDGVQGDPTRMQFPSEFEWISPSGRGLLTSYMADHYSSGWRMDAAPTLEEAAKSALTLFQGLKKVATTRNVLLPVGTDYTPPNKWVTRIHRDWNSRYTWPKFVCALPKEFFAAVRAELAERGEEPTPQSRDMNPIYTGKDVSYIDTKQAQREAEDLLLEAERYAVFASLLTGARYPDAAFAKAWVQLAYGAHHDGITGSESDQVYLDLLWGWREARELALSARNSALRVLTDRVDFSQAVGRGVVVWNSIAAPRTDLVTVHLEDPVHNRVSVVDDDGTELPALVDHEGHSVTFLARDVPSFGWRAYTIRLSTVDKSTVDEPVDSVDSSTWLPVDGYEIANAHHRIAVDPGRGGGVVSLVELPHGRELIATGRVGNELALYEEYDRHPRFGEGPWHLLPKGPVRVSGDNNAAVQAFQSPLGQRLVVRGQLGTVGYTQTITLWRGVSRVDCSTKVEEFTGSDQLLRLRWPCPVPGALPVSEVGDAVVGRGFGLPDVDSAEHPWTLDNPAYTWFGLSATARVSVGDSVRAIGVAELIAPSRAEAAPLARELTVALAQAGVTATCSTADGPRYGHLEVDSNLPDVRFALGGPDRNSFTAKVLAEADPSYREEVERQLGAAGRAMVWVPAERPLAEVWVPSADLRAARALPVLIIAGADLDAAIESIVDDLVDHEIEVRQDAPSGIGEFESRTVALLNRGVPGFAVDSAGTLHASLLRSCTGWPSGVWIDPPRRATPDGSGFQLQHWTHVFDYAVVSSEGDWRKGIPQRSAEFSRPLVAVLSPEDGVGGLPGSGSLLKVEPAGGVSLAALKALGNPLARGSAHPADPAEGIAVRLVETSGLMTEARVSSTLLSFLDPATADLLEQRGDSLADTSLTLAPFEIATLVARPELTRWSTMDGAPLGPEREVAQPLYTRYWMHNRGPAPMGGLPVAVHLDPVTGLVQPGGDITLTLTVASDCTDAQLHGVVRFVVPDGWTCVPPQLPFGLAPGGHWQTEVQVKAPKGAVELPHPIRAQLELTGEALPPSWLQVVEDVAMLSTVSEPAQPLRLAGAPSAVRVARGGRERLSVDVVGATSAPVSVEAQLLTPWGTWDATPDWWQVREVVGRAEFGFDIAPPPWAEPGDYWALVKIAGAGRILYSEAVALVVTA